MTTNLRISLAILSAGFAIEGAEEAYSLVTSGSFLPGTSILFLLPAVVTFLGLLFLLIGRHEWTVLHRERVRRTHLTFALSLLGAFVAAVEVALLAAYPGVGAPVWAEILFGAALGSLVFGTFVTYAQLVFHLVSRPGKGVLIASIVWAFLVSAYVGRALALDLPVILNLVGSRSLSISDLVAPVDYLASYLFVSYFLLLAAYLEAHAVVARGLPGGAPSSGPMAPARTPNP